MLPSKSWESAEIGVGRNHGAAVLDCNRRVLGVSDELPGRSGLTAQPSEYVQVIGSWTDDARGRAFHERGDEGEGLVESGWREKDSRIGYDADTAGFGCATHLLCKLVVKRNCGPHDAKA